MKHPIVMIEGPEECGKTYLAKCVSEYFGYRYCHLKQHRDYTAAQRGAVELAKERPTVIDRHLWSDQVYGTALRGGPENDGVQSRMWDWFLTRDVLLILCVPPSEREALDRWATSMFCQTVQYDVRLRTLITRLWYQLVFAGDYALAGQDFLRVDRKPVLATRAVESGGLLRAYPDNTALVYAAHHGRSSVLNILAGLLDTAVHAPNKTSDSFNP